MLNFHGSMKYEPGPPTNSSFPCIHACQLVGISFQFIHPLFHTGGMNIMDRGEGVSPSGPRSGHSGAGAWPSQAINYQMRGT
jgi:hypothetical protein